MKKTYLTPAIFEHKLRVESQILANSPINPDTEQKVGDDDPNNTSPNPDVNGTIDPATGDNGGGGWIGI